MSRRSDFTINPFITFQFDEHFKLVRISFECEDSMCDIGTHTYDEAQMPIVEFDPETYPGIMKIIDDWCMNNASTIERMR